MIRLAKPRKVDWRVDWRDFLLKFLASGEQIMEIEDWENHYKTFNAAYMSAYNAIVRHGFRDEVRVATNHSDRIFLERRDQNGGRA